MKHIIYIIAILLASTMPVTGMAQSIIDKAISDFLANSALSSHNQAKKTIQSGQTDITEYHYTYYFSLPANKEKPIKQLQKAFDQESANAYNYQTRPAGLNEDLITTVGFGENNQSFSFGEFKNRNYTVMFLHDKKQPKYRYAYVLLWYTDNKGKDITGQIHKFYSIDPKKKRDDFQREYNNIVAVLPSVTYPFYESQLKKITNLADLRKAVKSIQEGNWNVDKSISQKGISSLQKGTETILSLTRDDESAKNINDKNFLTVFNLLRSTISESWKDPDIEKESVRSTLATKLLELCKNNTSKLEPAEKKLCINSINTLIKENYNRTYGDGEMEFTKGLLNLCIEQLKK